MPDTIENLPLAKKLIVMGLTILIRWVKADLFFYSLLAGWGLLAFLDITLNIVTQDEITGYDILIAQLLNQFAIDPITRIFLWFTSLGGKNALVILGILLLVGFFVQKCKAQGILLFVTTTGGFVLMSLVKGLLERQRPILDVSHIPETGFSFPSGHATVSFCFYGTLLYLIITSRVSLWLKTLSFLGFGIVIILIGLSRVYLGVHYPSDVLAGFYLGLFWTSICTWIYRWWSARSAKILSG